MRSFFRGHDVLLSGAVFTIVALGLITIKSVQPDLFWAQFSWMLLGSTAGLVMIRIDFRPLITYRWLVTVLYVVVVALLVVTTFFAPVIRDARSWIVIGPVQFQTSELAKAVLILTLSYFFARAHVGIAQLKNLFISFVLFAIPALLIFLQPDLGSALILFMIWGGFLFVSGIPWKHLVIGIVILGVLGAVAWQFALADYQKERVIGFFDPSYDPLGVNYSVIQSKIAIGSAGFFGKGYGQGTQAQLGFLPESHSDFIFSAFIEEWGFLGGFVLVGIFTLLLVRIILIGIRSHNNFFRLVCLGVVIMFLAQFTFNVGSALGLLPVTGVTFPFFSHGGSSLLVNMMLLGIIQGIAMRATFLRGEQV